MQHSTRRDAGFSLVEVVLAVGVVAFAFVAVLGLIPAGLTQFRQAVDTSVCAQIAQRVIMDAQQSDFQTLTDWENLPKMANGMPDQDLTFRAPRYTEGAFRYFDEQGNEIVLPSNRKTLTPSEQTVVIYYANTRITPRTAFPRSASSEGSDSESDTDSRAQATVTVQVAFNPGHRALKFHTGSGKRGKANWNLIDTSQTPGIPIKTYSAQVGRN